MLALAAGLIAAALLLFFWAWFQWSDNRSAPNAGAHGNRAFLAGVALLVSGALAAVQLVSNMFQRIELYTGGIIVKSPLFQSGFRWCDIDEVVSSGNHSLTVLNRGPDGRVLSIPGDAVAGAEQLSQVVLDRARAVLVPEMVEKLRRGERVSCGRLEAGSDGLTCYRGQFPAPKNPSLYKGPWPTGKQHQEAATRAGNQVLQFTWSDVLGVQVSPQGSVVLQSSKGSADLRCAPEDVPNIFIIPEVAGVMRGQGSRYLAAAEPSLQASLPLQNKKNITNLVRGVVVGVCLVIGFGMLFLILGLSRRGSNPPDQSKKNEQANVKLEPPEFLWSIPFNQNDQVRRAAFHQMGHKIVVCVGYPNGAEVKLWDTITRDELKPLYSSSDPVYDFAFNDIGTRLTMAFGDLGVKVYELNEKKIKWEFPMPGACRRVVMSPDAGWVAGVSTDPKTKKNIIKLWELGANREAWRAEVAARHVTPGFTRDSNLLLGGKPGQVIVYPSTQGKEAKPRILPTPGSKGEVLGVAVTQEGNLFAVYGLVNPVPIWKVGEPKVWKKIPVGAAGDCLAAVFSYPDGKVLATAHAGGKVHFWDVAKETELVVLDTKQDQIQSMEFSAGNRFLTGDKSAIKVWEVDKIVHR
jgi:WD40 repeat protein